jgi:hypothetical protein
VNIENFYINNWASYLIHILVLTVLFRLLIAIMKSLESPYRSSSSKKYSFWERVWIAFSGFSKKETHPDLWYPSILGIIEMMTFPILIKAQLYSAIGAWVAFKTVSQWKVWGDDRNVFNRFLIAHALLLIICFLILLKFVSIKPA